MRVAAAALALGCALLATVPATAVASGIEVRTVRFAKGESSATTKGSIKGDRTIDYKLRAKAGQTMSVSLKTTNGANYFNVLPPGSSDVAVFAGSTGGNEWKGKLEADGEYTIRVYLMRSAARRNETANYTLSVGITGASSGATAPAAAAAGASPAERAGMGKFDATGNIPCAQAKGQPMGQCAFGVARGGAGTAALVVTRTDGRKRTIFFDKGKATGADLSQADGNMEFRATKEADLYRIQAGNERYEIPEAAIFGG
jgi:hypothetical protein